MPVLHSLGSVRIDLHCRAMGPEPTVKVVIPHVSIVLDEVPAVDVINVACMGSIVLSLTLASQSLQELSSRKIQSGEANGWQRG